MIVLENVSKRYGKLDVLKDITFAVHPNEFVCVTGPSGAGKSTLFHIMIGAERITSGKINIDGVELRRVPHRALQVYRRRIGIVFQDYRLLWNRTVRENIAFPLEVCGAHQKIIDKRVDEILEQMHLTKQEQTLCHALSGGEKARTAVARAIVHKPMIIFADEPTGNLDPYESVEVAKLFKTIHSNGATVMLATHDTVIVDALKTRVIHLDNGQITRDSVGKYKEKKTTAASEKKTKVKAEDEPEVSADSPDEGKSVKITATS